MIAEHPTTVEHHETARPKRRRLRRAVASWYGPGFYGNTFACGGTYTFGAKVVAHKKLPCGTKIRICFRKCTNAVVQDRGPYAAGRDFDLTVAVKNAVQMPNGVKPVRWRFAG